MNKKYVMIYPISKKIGSNYGTINIDNIQFNKIINKNQTSVNKYKLMTYRNFQLKITNNIKQLDEVLEINSYIDNTYSSASNSLLISINEKNNNIDINLFPNINKYYNESMIEHHIININNDIELNLIKTSNDIYYIYLSLYTSSENDIDTQFLMSIFHKYMAA
jgi:hypothetical protein